MKLFREESQAEPVTLSDSSTVAQVFIADIADLPVFSVVTFQSGRIELKEIHQ